MSHILHIYNAETRFFQAGEHFGFDELYDALKYHYSDVCCNDDVLINKLIDALYDRASREELFKIDEEEIIHNITHTIEIWLRQDKMTPDPFWADDIDEKSIKRIIVIVI